MILLVCRKFRAVVVASLLVAGLGLMLPLSAAAGQADRARFSDDGLLTPAKVLSWVTGLWQDLSGLWAGGAVEKTGGGDGFVGGMLYAMLRGWKPEKWIQFGWATGALVTTLLTDYARPADEEQIWSIWAGNARVRR